MKKQILLITSFLFLTSCTPGNLSETSITSDETTVVSSQTTANSTATNISETSISFQKQTFTDVFFDDAFFVYDGKTHILNEVRGVPENTKVTYTGRQPKIHKRVSKESSFLQF